MSSSERRGFQIAQVRLLVGSLPAPLAPNANSMQPTKIKGCITVAQSFSGSVVLESFTLRRHTLILKKLVTFALLPSLSTKIRFLALKPSALRILISQSSRWVSPLLGTILKNWLPLITEDRENGCKENLDARRRLCGRL